jgi:hypothetical protein
MLENVPDIVQSTHGIRNIFADIRNVPSGVPCEFYSTSSGNSLEGALHLESSKAYRS